jgi:hypothetical protein
MALTYASNIAASSQGAFAIFPVTDSVGGAAFDILQADISTGVVSAVSSAVPLSSLQTGVLTEILQALRTATSGIADALPYFRKLAGVLTTQNGDSVAVSAVNVAGTTWKMQAALTGPGTALVYIPNSAAAGIYTGAGSDNGAVPFGPAGGVLGYTGSTYPNPNGLAAIANVIPILRNTGAAPTAITIRPDAGLTTDGGTPLTVKAADAGPGATTNDGGALTLQGGVGGSAAGGVGGDAQMIAGSGAAGGVAVVRGGLGNAGAGGELRLIGGVGTGAQGGSLYIEGGDSNTGDYGVVAIGTSQQSNTRRVRIGKADETPVRIESAPVLLSLAQTATAGAPGNQVGSGGPALYAQYRLSSAGAVTMAADPMPALGGTPTLEAGAEILVINVGANNITFNTGGNLRTPSGAAMVVGAGGSFRATYEGLSQKWFVTSFVSATA